MTNKKLLTPIFIAASFLLVACSTDTVVARPVWQTDDVIVDSNGIKDNKMKAIYDAIKKLGDTNSNVLTKVMSDISQKYVGTYSELKTYGSETDLDKIKILIATPEFKEFVKKHQRYKADTKGATRNDTSTTKITLTEEQQGLTSFYKIKDQYDQLVNDVYEKLYDEIKGGSYSTTNTKLFEEDYFIDHLYKELYEVKNYDDYKGRLVSDVIFTPKSKETSWKEYVNFVPEDQAAGTKAKGYLNVFDTEKKELTGIYDDYIEHKILPEIYKSYLTQMYVKEQRYSALGRSYARKVNMISITADDNNRFHVSSMLKYFANNYINNNDKLPSYNFEWLSKAMIGIVPNSDSTEDASVIRDLLKNNFDLLKITQEGSITPTIINYLPQVDEYGKEITPDVNNAVPVYDGTKLGDIIKKLAQCCDLVLDDKNNLTSYSRKQHLTDEQIKIYDELTNNKGYIVKGITSKERELRQTDYTKDGWFLKNGGLTDISTAIRDRLFSITISTQVDDYARKANKDKAAQESDYIKYFGATDTPEHIKDRKAFLTMKGTSSEVEKRIVLNEEGNDNYYMIEVEEAANSAKLSIADNYGSYIYSKSYASDIKEAHLSVIKSNTLAHEITKANSNSDTYKKNANEYYLMISNIIFYDQSVYDYFKSQFPDLFK